MSLWHKRSGVSDISDLAGTNLVVQTYCWMYSTFNIPPGFEGRCARRRQSEDLMYNSYYQWVALCLVGQVGPEVRED